jgi:hypothetical protein
MKPLSTHSKEDEHHIVIDCGPYAMVRLIFTNKFIDNLKFAQASHDGRCWVELGVYPQIKKIKKKKLKK